MLVSVYYKLSLFNAHAMILIVHIFMNVNKLCLNQMEINLLRTTRGNQGGKVVYFLTEKKSHMQSSNLVPNMSKHWT